MRHLEELQKNPAKKKETETFFSSSFLSFPFACVLQRGTIFD